MKKIFKRVNKALEKKLGSGVVDLRPCDWGDYPYMLHFSRMPRRETLQQAKQIVDGFIPTLWDEENMRYEEDGERAWEK